MWIPDTIDELCYDQEVDGEPRTFHGRGGAQFLGSFNSDGAFRPDGRRFAAGATDNADYVWDLDRGEPARRLEGHHARPMCVAYSPDGRRIAYLNTRNFSSGALRLVNADDGAALAAPDAVQGGGKLAFHPDGRRVLGSF